MIALVRQSRKRKILLIILLALILRFWAVFLLPQDFDEPIYLQNAFDYAKLINKGDINGIIDYQGGREHPALVKLIYGLDVAFLGKNATWANAFYLSRSISAIFGSLATLVVSLMVEPLSGGLLAVHTLAVKYTSQVYLESLPHLLSILAVLTFVRASKLIPDKWFWISALCLGAATAGKFTYTPAIVIVIGYLFIFEKNTLRKWLLPYSLIALISFIGLDITLWHDPFRRLVEAVTFHASYSQGMHVQGVGYPWFQPFIWVFTSFPAEVHPEVFFYFGFDGIISVLGISAIKQEWTERRWLVIWFVAGMFFLLIWPTKWPQYALIVTPALCIMAAGTLHRLINWVRE
ncbi:MAG TPA: hypothetical protein VGK10_01175, partial [Prolixibacteraceae bacterium]